MGYLYSISGHAGSSGATQAVMMQTDIMTGASTSYNLGVNIRDFKVAQDGLSMYVLTDGGVLRQYQLPGMKLLRSVTLNGSDTSFGGIALSRDNANVYAKGLLLYEVDTVSFTATSYAPPSPYNYPSGVVTATLISPDDSTVYCCSQSATLGVGLFGFSRSAKTYSFLTSGTSATLSFTDITPDGATIINVPGGGSRRLALIDTASGTTTVLDLSPVSVYLQITSLYYDTVDALCYGALWYIQLGSSGSPNTIGYGVLVVDPVAKTYEVHYYEPPSTTTYNIGGAGGIRKVHSTGLFYLHGNEGSPSVPYALVTVDSSYALTGTVIATAVGNTTISDEIFPASAGTQSQVF